MITIDLAAVVAWIATVYFANQGCLAFTLPHPWDEDGSGQ